MEIKGNQTKIIHTEYTKTDAYNALRMPIYGNAAFEFATAEQMADAFQGRIPDHAYSRITNPTVEHFEKRIQTLTGAKAVTALASGMAAISNTFFTIARSGDNIVTSPHLFGNTYTFLKSTLAAFGVEVRFCDLTITAEIENAIDNKTCAVFFETITNPQLEIVDIHSISTIAKKHGIPVITDSTLTPVSFFESSKFGIDIDVFSTTKIFSGGATTVGGIIVDYGTFDWKKNGKLAPIVEKFGAMTFHAKLRKEIFRNVGACMSPYNAYQQSVAMETMEMRFEKLVANAKGLAEYLQTEPKVKSVNYPGLKSSKYFEIGQNQFGNYPGAILCINLESREECFSFLNKLKFICRATNLYDNRTLIIHPASTIYWDMTDELRDSLGIPQTLIRISPGIENLEDLIADIHQALN